MGAKGGRWALWLAVATAAATRTAPAAADPEPVTKPPPHAATLEERTDLPLGEKRPPQDYDGRPARTSVRENLLWIPRVLLFPLYFTTDFLVRRPLGAIDTAVEKNDVIPRAVDLFTFGPNHNAGIVPTAFVDFGFQPSLGLYLFYDDFLARHNDMRLSISSGGARWLKAKVVDRIPLALARDADGELQPSSYLQLELDGLARPDLLFFGIGYGSQFHDRGKFEERSAGGGARFHVNFAKGSFLESWLTLRRYAFTDGDCDVSGTTLAPLPNARISCTRATLLGEVRDGRYRAPPGFEGYAAAKAGGRLVLDSRAPRPYAGSGVALDVRSDVATSFSGQLGTWVSYAASLAGFVDVTGTRRVLGLTLDARFADALEHGFAIPFTELVGAPRADYVPDDDMMRGFLPGRLLGTSSLTATLDYEWPVWSFADGTIQLATGNAFGNHLHDFRFDRARLSFVAGITSPNHRDHAFNLLLGFGTRPIRDGAAPESVRFLFGGTTGF